MIKSKTVFIVGAGASCEVGLPLGRELRTRIASSLAVAEGDFQEKRFAGDEIIHNALQRKFARRSAYLPACGDISTGVHLSASIDDFVDQHREDETITICSKLAIVREILRAEQQSDLGVVEGNIFNTIDFASVEETWYPAFYQLLTQNVQKSQLSTVFSNVTVVSFNYDRCVEHFLSHAIAANYRIKLDEAIPFVQELKMFRPFGSVGALFGQRQDSIGFGSGAALDIERDTRNIRTYSEQVQNPVSLADMQASIDEADMLVFLGNAYHENNMKLLLGEKKLSGLKRIFATRKGISDSDVEIVHKKLMRFHGSHFVAIARNNHFLAGSCAELFNEYRLHLRE